MPIDRSGFSDRAAIFCLRPAIRRPGGSPIGPFEHAMGSNPDARRSLEAEPARVLPRGGQAANFTEGGF